MAEIPKINCSSNGLLDTLNAKKDALAAKVGEIQSAGSAALADIKAKANSMKDSLLEMIPEPPETPNFIKELNELKNKAGAELAAAEAALRERWGDVVENIDKMIAKVQLPDFNPCEDKEIPNVDATEVDPETGKVTAAKEKGPDPTTPIEVPAKVEAVQPTVVANEKGPSSNQSFEEEYGISQLDMWLDQQKYVDESVEIINTKLRVYNKWQKKWNKTVNSEKWESYVERREQAGFLEISDYYNSGLSSKSDKKLVRNALEGYNEAHLANATVKYQSEVINLLRFYAGFDKVDNVSVSNKKVLIETDNQISFITDSISENERVAARDEVLEIANKYRSALNASAKYRR